MQARGQLHGHPHQQQARCWSLGKQRGGPAVPTPSSPSLLPPLKLCTHPLQIPSSLASSIPDKFEYWDEVRYDPKLLAEPPYELQVQSEAPFLGEKVRGHPHCCPSIAADVLPAALQ